MKWMIVFLCLINVNYAMTKSRELPRDLHIGVHTEKFEDVSRKRPVLVEIWYPTDQTGPIDHPEDNDWIHPEEIRDVAIVDRKFPLIVMSHGHGGDRRDRSWLVEYLVKSGFIVASVEHYGNTWRNYNPLLTIRFWERAKDITFAITKLLKDPLFKKHIDPLHIGFVGYSLGGMTGLALAGAKAQNVKQIVLSYLKSNKEVEPELVEKIDFSEASHSFKDRRIRAMALLSPAAFIFPPQSLEKIRVPIALVASEVDEVLPHQEHALKIIQHLGPAKLKLFKDKVSHYVFLNRVSEKGKSSIRKDLQAEEIELSRAKIHKEVGEFLAAFFKDHLSSRP